MVTVLAFILPLSSFFDTHGRGTHSPWTSVPSLTLRGGACNQVSCLDLWVPRFPRGPTLLIANRLWVHFSPTSRRQWHIPRPFTSASLDPPQRNADKISFYPQMPAVKMNPGTPACPSPGVNSPLTLLLHRRHHRLHRLTAVTTH